MEKIEVMAISDLHGKLPDLRGHPCDLLLIAGDIMPEYAEHSIDTSIEWYTTDFYRWCKSMVTADKIFFILGSHDYALENYYPMVYDFYQKINNGKVQMLHNEIKIYRKGRREISVYGTPYNRNSRRYAFSRSEKDLKRIYAKFDEDIDIILTHEAPYGFSDTDPMADEYIAKTTHMGSMSLKKFIEETDPDVVVHGKYHSATHVKERLGDTSIYNVSLLDDNYEQTYLPTKFVL